MQIPAPSTAIRQGKAEIARGDPAEGAWNRTFDSDATGLMAGPPKNRHDKNGNRRTRQQVQHQKAQAPASALRAHGKQIAQRKILRLHLKFSHAGTLSQ